MTDFVEMSGKANKLNEFMKNKHLGSDTQIPTRWSKFFKSIKIKYLKLKKLLAFKK